MRMAVILFVFMRASLGLSGILQAVIVFQQRNRFPLMSVGVPMLVVSVIMKMRMGSIVGARVGVSRLFRLLLPDFARQILLTVRIHIDLDRAYAVALNPRNLQPRPDV